MDGFITIGTKLDTKEFDAQILDLERKANDLERAINVKGKAALDPEELHKAQVELEKTKNKLVQLYNQKMKLDSSSKKNALANSFKDSVKQAGRLALAIFGIRSAYMLLRRASSELASYDSQYAANLEYIRFVLTQAIAPVLRGIVNLAMQLLQVINAIAQGWFGVNIFANGSVEAFKKMKSNAGGVTRAVKQIKKELTGFDEITRLSEDGSTSGGAGGIDTPFMDLSAMQGETPKWLQWIIDNKDLLLSVIAGITAGIIAWKLGLDGIKSLGVGVLIAGILYTVQNLIKYLKDPSWTNFGKVVQGIGVALIGLGLIIGSVPVALAGAITLILGLLAQNWDKVKGGFQKAIDWIKGLGDKAWQWFLDNIEKIQLKFGWLGTGITATFLTIFSWLTELVAGIVKLISDVLEGLFIGVKQILDGIISMFKGDFKSGIISIGKGIVNAIIGILNGLISGVNAIAYPLRAVIAGIANATGRNISIEAVSIPKIPYLKTGAILNMPNKGTLVGGTAFAGESGREGIVPLTDQQAMAELGREIGRNVLVNLTNITNMNGRVIGRELKQIQNEQDFAYNT